MAESDPAERDVERYRNNLQGEIDSAALYGAMAESEANPQLKEVYRRLAAVEDAHAEFWRSRLKGLGASGGARRAGLRTRILIWLARRFGPAILLPLINSFERSDSHVYDAQPEAISEGLPQAERSHARIIEAAA
ncbi:MAG: ferritin family protein, partial [Stellaceae bacterium]